MNTRPDPVADLDRLAELFDQDRIFYEQSSDLAAARALLSARFDRGALSAGRLCWFDRPIYIRGK